MKTGKNLFAHHVKEKKNLFEKKQSKDEEWSEIRAELKEKFFNAGIISCELQLDGCTGAYNFGFTWGFAHTLKRNQICSAKEDEVRRAKEIRSVAYLCGSCHKIIEDKGNRNNEMYDIVMKVIDERKVKI